MKTITIAGITSLVFLVAPMLVQAQVQGDVNPNNAASSCTNLMNNLSYRSTDILTGGEVSQLQDFLQSAGYLASEPTGYFGLLTQAAVKRFQTASGILSSGYVGPITRAKIQGVSCGQANTNPGSSSPLPGGCRPGDLFSPTTGERCNAAVACTMEVKVCPDGSYVGRQGPSCSFAACPVPTAGACAIKEFTAAPSTVTAGKPITLSWTTQNCGLVALNAGQQHSEGIYGEINGKVLSPSGTLVVYPKTYTPTATYTMKYALSAVAKAGDGSKAVEKIITVTILPAPETPSLTVTYPNGGETLLLGKDDSDFRINWVSRNITGNMKIYLKSQETSRALCYLATTPISRGTHLVAVGTAYQCPDGGLLTPGQYKVFLTAWDNVTPTTPGYDDSSDNFFTLVK